MTPLIPLSRLSRLVGQPRSVLQRMAQSGELETFDGHVSLDEVLRHFPDVELSDDAEIRRVEEIKDLATAKVPARGGLPDVEVLQERLRALSRDYAAAQERLLHLERVVGWIDTKLDEAVDAEGAAPEFADGLRRWLKRELAAPADDFGRWRALLARERVMRVMAALVTLRPGGQTFEVVGDESILEAGLRAGLSLPYGCSNGTCGDCRCRVVGGDVLRVRPHDFVLSAAEKEQRTVLACAYSAVGDVEIEVPLSSIGDIPEQTIKTKVRSIEPLSPDRIALHLLTPRAERLRYLAGQSIEIEIAGLSRVVPAASCPCEGRRIEVHVDKHRGDAFDERLLQGLTVNDDVVIRGPFGSFVLDDASARPLLLVAEGAGFAPIKSLLQHALSLDLAPSIQLLRLADRDGPYQENLLKSYAAALDNFRYRAFDADAGVVALLKALDDDFASLAAHDVYVAGRAGFVAAVAAHCKAGGLPDDRFRSTKLA